MRRKCAAQTEPADEHIQRSVAMRREDFIASRLTALAEHFGACVASFEVEREGISQDSRREARSFVERVLHQRLHRRGRRRSTVVRRKV